MKQISIEYSDEDECYIARTPILPNITGFGDTPEDALRELKVASSLVEEVMREESIKNKIDRDNAIIKLS